MPRVALLRPSLLYTVWRTAAGVYAHLRWLVCCAAAGKDH